MEPLTCPSAGTAGQTPPTAEPAEKELVQWEGAGGAERTRPLKLRPGPVASRPPLPFRACTLLHTEKFQLSREALLEVGVCPFKTLLSAAKYLVSGVRLMLFWGAPSPGREVDGVELLVRSRACVWSCAVIGIGAPTLDSAEKTTRANVAP